jgi:hypothetical protein
MARRACSSVISAPKDDTTVKTVSAIATQRSNLYPIVKHPLAIAPEVVSNILGFKGYNGN